MKKELYDFLFTMRASGFTHHTPESIESLHTLTDYCQDNSAFLPALNELIDGEAGVLSNNELIDMRNMLIGLTFLACQEAVAQNVDSEYAYGISDYYLKQAETLRSRQQLIKLSNEMMNQYYSLIQKIRRPHYGHLIDSCIHYIDQHLYQSLTAEQVAIHAKRSLPYLTSLFRTTTGLSLHAYIQQRKMDEAKVMLRNTSQPLREIAAALGYSSLPHFSKVFKNTTGMTPSTFRNGI